MTCAEFQRVLPYIIESGGKTDEEGHLRSCPVCADLVADLKYIAEQAKLLVPMEEPSPRVWLGIRASLEREGMIRSVRPRGLLLALLPLRAVPWVATAAAIVLVAAASLLYQRQAGRGPARTAAASVAAEQPSLTLASTRSTASEDQQLLSEIGQRDPDLRAAYESNFIQVNQSISDARKSVEQDPDDEDAAQALIRACQQRVMLYDMAMSSLR